MRWAPAACLCLGAWLGWHAYPAQARQIDQPVTLYGDVDERTASIVVSQIQAANRLRTSAPILMFIDSPGGSVLAGNRIVDAMQASRRPIYTVDVEFAASMAAYIWAFGEQRYMMPRAILMLHDASLEGDGELDHL
jgi:ATP-dependent Clp protease protease subunit